MPEISGPGQKKLLDSLVVIQSETAEDSAPLLYYLAAAGVGHINLVLQDEQGWEMLSGRLSDLNSDVSITFGYKLSDKIPADSLTFKIILGSEVYVANSLINKVDTSMPMIIAMNRDWEGYIQVFKQREQMESAISELQGAVQHRTVQPKEENSMGRIFSTCLLGTLTAIESIKLILDIGTSAENPFDFNLLSMSFNNHEKNNLTSTNFFAPTTDACSKPANSRGLADYKALVVGTGGLGSPAAYALVKAGIGTIGLVDYDTVDISNLNRQILHSTSRMGLPKVDSAEIFLQQLNPDVIIIKHPTNFNADNALEIISGYDVIIDGVDNFPTRYLLNDACYLKKKPMLEAGVAAFDGMGLTIIPDESMCYRCIFPTIPAPGAIPSCSESGVLGPVPGVMGFIEACEAAKLLTAQGTLLTNNLLAFDALDINFEVLQLEKNPQCALCGNSPSIRELKDYKFVCKT